MKCFPVRIISFFFFSVFFLFGCDSGSDSDSDTDLGNSWLKVDGREYSLSKLNINNEGLSSVEGVYTYYVSIISENLNMEKPGSGSGEYVYITLFSSSSDIFHQDDYDYSGGEPESGKFRCNEDAFICTDFAFPEPAPTEYIITGGLITINIIDGTFYISGEVTTSGGPAQFRYAGPETGY